MGVVSGIAVLQIEASRPGLQRRRRDARGPVADEPARELAITQRRYMRVVFTPEQPGPDRPRRSRPAPASTTLVDGARSKAACSSRSSTGLPDTPDALRQRATAVDFGAAHRREVHARRHARQSGRRHDQRHRVSGDSEPDAVGARGHGARIDRPGPRLQWDGRMEAGVTMRSSHRQRASRSSKR